MTIPTPTLVLPKINGTDHFTQINVQTLVISAETSVRKASFFLAMNVGHLLRADNPKLLLDRDFLQWQLDIMLTSPTGDPPRRIGQICLNAQDGMIMLVNELEVIPCCSPSPPPCQTDLTRLRPGQLTAVWFAHYTLAKEIRL